MFYSLPVAMLMVIVCYSTIPSASSAYTQGIDLGTCSNFAMQAGTAVDFNGAITMVSGGNVGVSPGISITGSYMLSDGSVENSSPAAIQCASDEGVAYLAAQAAVCTAANNLANPDLSGKSLSSGVYCASFIELTAGALTLDGQGNSSSVWVFQSATTMVTGTSTSFILINGAQTKNIYWELGTALTVGADSTFVGTVLAGTAVNLNSGSTLLGRAFAQSSISCENGNTIIAPSSSSSSSPTKSPSRPTNRPTKNPSTSQAPSKNPNRPTNRPTKNPVTAPSYRPSGQPRINPTNRPTKSPSSSPTVASG